MATLLMLGLNSLDMQGQVLRASIRFLGRDILRNFLNLSARHNQKTVDNYYNLVFLISFYPSFTSILFGGSTLLNHHYKLLKTLYSLLFDSEGYA
jgi:hypothetical protein